MPVEPDEESRDGPFYVCPVCGRTSYHPADIANRYCGACHTYSASPEPSIAALLQESEEAMFNYLVAKSQALVSDGCCSDPSWRGHLCQYHEGLRDGLEEMWRITTSLFMPPAGRA